MSGAPEVTCQSGASTAEKPAMPTRYSFKNNCVPFWAGPKTGDLSCTSTESRSLLSRPE